MLRSIGYVLRPMKGVGWEKGEGVKPPKDEARAFSHAFVFP